MDGGVFNNYPIKAFDKRCYLNSQHTMYDSHSTEACHNDETLGFRLEESISLYQAFLRGHELPRRVLASEDDTISSRLMELLTTLLPSTTYLNQAKESLKAFLHLNHQLQLLPSILFGAQQQYHQSDIHDWRRTVFITPGSIGTLDFNLKPAQKEEALENGEVGWKLFSARIETTNLTSQRTWHFFGNNHQEEGSHINAQTMQPL